MEEERISDYDYALPEGRIAARPAAKRTDSRLFVLPCRGPAEHRRFFDLPGYLRPGDLLVLNDTRVVPARLAGRKPTGARAEALLTSRMDEAGRRWKAMVRPGSKLSPGRTIIIGSDLKVHIERSAPGGRVVRLETSLSPGDAIRKYGRTPIPPYLNREADEDDALRYQTVYAKHDGSAAAPTAGLHFDDALLEEVKAAGCGIAKVTLHVGPGTFAPVTSEEISRHALHAEEYVLSEETASRHGEHRRRGGRIWAVGTTVARVLETRARKDGTVKAGAGWTDLFIRPPRRPLSFDCLVTNFHLPKSTLLMLVAAVAGRKRVLAAYREAIRRGYRFYSYGDAMAVIR